MNRFVVVVGATIFCLAGCAGTADGNARSAIVSNPFGLVTEADALKAADHHCWLYNRSARLNYRDKDNYYFDCLE
jgi:hypothetical protein